MIAINAYLDFHIVVVIECTEEEDCKLSRQEEKRPAGAWRV